MTFDDRFIEQFSVAFLATWCANNYADACARGEQDRLEHPPVEDALFLAEAALKEWKIQGLNHD